MNEKISVLMPTYNRDQFLDQSISSILHQSFKNIKLIIYDDGSTDKTQALIQDYQKIDSRIIYIRDEKNKGVGYARNKLLDVCDTRFACWMDSDDISSPERVWKQLIVMGVEPQMVYCTWENLKTKIPGTTRGFATLMFPVNKKIRFPEDMKFGAEDTVWREKMEMFYDTADVNEVLYSINFHGDRIGTWKRKIDKNWNGAYDLDNLKNLSYEECINKYKKEHNG